MLKIQTFPLPPVQTNAFLLWDTESKQALLIDAPLGAWSKVEPTLKREGLTLEGCILTHAHFDHVLDGETLNAAKVPLSLHEDGRELLARLPEQLRLFGVPGEAGQVAIDTWLTTPGELSFLGRSVEIRHVPGHSPDNIVIYFPSEKLAFVGDAIFAGSIGRTDLPGGDFGTLERSIRGQIYTLPDDTTLYPGHGPATTVLREKETNPYVPA